MAWLSKSAPSRKPRLKGVFRGESMVSHAITELIDFGLRKLAHDLVDRGQQKIGEIPVLFACAETSPPPSHPAAMVALEPRRAARDVLAAGAS